jgi:tetratricopeptide (TPR) repeat protein
MKMRPTAPILVLMLLACAAPAVAQPAASGSSGDAAYYFLLGRRLEAAGDVEKAVAAFRQALELAPESAELRAELAGLYARQDRALDAIDAAEEALTKDPDNREANRILGSILAAVADQRVKLKPGDDPALYVPRAIAALERARAQGADTPIDLTLGRLYLQTKSYDKAIGVLRRVQLEQPGSAELAMMIATAEEGAGRTADAAATLREAIANNPKFFRGLVMLAELSEKQDQWDAAADAYEKAQALNPRVDLASRRAAALINAGKAAAARDLLQPGAARPDAEPIVLYLYAAALRQSGDLAGAEAAARRLRAAAPNDPRGLYVMAQVLEERKDLDGAEQALREILKKDPEDATALNYLGYMLAERGQRLDEAISLVQRALKIEPGNPSFLDSLGWAYFQQGKLDLADPPLTEAASKMPNNSVIQDHLGDLRFKQRRFSDATEAWQRALNGDGESIDRPAIEKKIIDAKSRLENR